MLNRCKECFDSGTEELGKSNKSQMSIKMPDDIPITYRPYRLSYQERDKIRSWITRSFVNRTHLTLTRLCWCSKSMGKCARTCITEPSKISILPHQLMTCWMDFAVFHKLGSSFRVSTNYFRRKYHSQNSIYYSTWPRQCTSCFSTNYE